MPPIRIAIALRRGWIFELVSDRIRVQPDMIVIRGIGQPAQVAALVHESAVDVALVDRGLLPASITGMALDLRLARPRLGVVLVSGSAGASVVADAGRAGWGFVGPNHGVDDVLREIRAMASGAAVERRSPTAGRSSRGLEGQLTSRERTVLGLMAQGRSPAQIALELDRSVNTVRHHVHRILVALGVHSQVAAVAVAVREGLVPTPGL